MDLLTILPEELLELLITYLDGVSTLYLGSTCSILHHLTSQPKVWRRLLARTSITTITREVEKLAKGDLKAIYFLSHRLRNHWGSGVVGENEVWSQASRMFYGPILQMFAANETWAVRVNLKPENLDGLHYQTRAGIPNLDALDAPDFNGRGRAATQTNKQTFLEVYNLCEDSSDQGFDFGEAVLDFGETVHLPYYNIVERIKYVERVFVLESFIVILHICTEHTADMMVFSIQDQKYLYNQEATLDLRNFLRGVKMDVTNFKNYIAAVRMKSITLYQVMKDQVIVKELELDENIRGVFQYCKFMAWNETHMAHPFQAHPGDAREFDVEVEHRIYCWDQATWNTKLFRIKGRVSDIQQSIELHGGKLFAAQISTVRIWDVESGALEKCTMLENIHSPSGKFITTDKLGIHLHPATQTLIGVESNTLHDGPSAIPMYSIRVVTLDGETIAFLDVPREKDKHQMKIHLVGPRLVILYSDNSYSVVDLEVETSRARDDPNERELLTVLPLGSAHKKGTLVSQRSLVTCKEYLEPDAYCMPYFTHVSQFNIVISHSSKDPVPTDYIHTFNFL